MRLNYLVGPKWLHIAPALAVCALFALTLGCQSLTPPPDLQDTRLDINQIKLELGDMRSDQQEMLRMIQRELELLNQKVDTQDAGLNALREDMNTQFFHMRQGTVPPTEIGETPGDQSGEPLTEAEMLRQAEEAYARGDYEDAIARYEAFVGAYPDSVNLPDARLHIGRCHYMHKDFEQAHKAFNKVVEWHPDSPLVPNAYYSRALCELQLRNMEAARRTLQILKTEYPTYQPEQIDLLISRYFAE